MTEAAPAWRDGSISDIVATLVATDGTDGHPYPAEVSPSLLTRSLTNLADAVHYLCMLHGRHPGVIDHAAVRTADNAARTWLVRSAEGFAAERSYLTQLAVAVGPLPSTAGQDACEAAVLQQRHALDMLAQSDRRGCAIGAAAALVLDWRSVRRLLDVAALRVGVEPRPTLLPNAAMTFEVLDALTDGDAAIDRAIQFGANQLLRQHRGLWDMLQARASLRARS
jgi:hypothetical protein